MQEAVNSGRDWESFLVEDTDMSVWKSQDSSSSQNKEERDLYRKETLEAYPVFLSSIQLNINQCMHKHIIPGQEKKM